MTVTVKIHLESLASYLNDLGGMVWELYDLVPEYQSDRDRLRGEIEDRLNLLLQAAKEGSTDG